MAESEIDLQIALNVVYEYCNDWYLTVNTSKTKIVVFSRGKIRKLPVIKFGDSILEVVFEYTYLGILFNYNNTFQKAIAKLVTQAKRAMYSLSVKCKKLMLPIDMQIQLFHQTIAPILLYGSEIWGFEKLDQIEIFHKKFLKNLLGLNMSTTSSMVYGETGELDMSFYVQNRMLNFWLKLSTGKQHKLSCTIYRFLKYMSDNNIYESKWLRHVKHNLDRRGFSNLWYLDYNTIIVSESWFKNSLKLRGADIISQLWHSTMWNQTACFNYRIFKENRRIEKYLSVLEYKDRLTLCKFRCRNSYLPVCKK